MACPVVPWVIRIAFTPTRAFNDQGLFTIFATIGSYIVGRILGKSASYGSLGLELRRHKIPIEVQPGHLDGAAGLKPVGDLFFSQAMLLAIPALHLAIWWMIIPLFEGYAGWRDPLPIDDRIRRQFTFRNAGLLLPIATKLVELSGIQQAVEESLNRIITTIKQ